MRKVITLALTLFLTVHMSNADAACVAANTKTCIEVSVENGKLVLDGKRAGSSSTPKPKPRIGTTPKPRIKRSVTATVKRKYTYRPRTTKPRPKTSTPALADRVMQALPTLQASYQPEGAALTKVPVIFFTDLPPFFNKTISIIGVPVRINAYPISEWQFGDGHKLRTLKTGKPYPSTDITHTYERPGTYPVIVNTTWLGSLTIAGVTVPIPRGITSKSAVDVRVVGATTSFVGK